MTSTLLVRPMYQNMLALMHGVVNVQFMLALARSLFCGIMCEIHAQYCNKVLE